MSLSRRELFKKGALASALAALGCSDRYSPDKPPVPGADAFVRGQERQVTSVCGMCPAGCGIKVRVVEGRAVKIDGHPECPMNEGRIGPKGQSGLQLLYHKDRIKGPLRREGARGQGRFVQISWDEAIAELAERLGGLREAGEARGLVIVDGPPRGPMVRLWQRFAQAFGTPNHVSHWSTADGGRRQAMHMMTGVPDVPAYDWDETRYVLGFGDGFFESTCQSIHLMRTARLLKRGTPGRRIKFVQVSPRFSITSTKADEWIPIEPGSHGALALAIARVLIEEELVDGQFLAEHCFGFDPWQGEDGVEHRGFRQMVLEDYPMEDLRRATGIPLKTIQRMAREMAANRPAVAISDQFATATSNGLGSAMAILALNALLGNVQRPGGLVLQPEPPWAAWDAVVLDETARTGLSAPRLDGAGSASCALGLDAVQRLPRAFRTQKPYAAQALFLYMSNPIFTKPDGEQWQRTIKEIPLVVSFSPIRDESTLCADYVLPDPTYLERWELVEPVPSIGKPMVCFREPVVEPLFDTRATGDVVIALAQALGGSIAESFAWKDFRAAQLEALGGVVQARRGTINEKKMSKFGAALRDQGCWWDPEAPQPASLPTPSGKLELFSQTAAALLAGADSGELESALREAQVTRRGDALCMPAWEAPHWSGTLDEYPLLIVPYRGIAYAEGGARHIPFLRELPLSLVGDGQIELNPQDAARFGIADGVRVSVESPAGKCVLKARLMPGIRPGTAGLPLGHGRWPPEPGEVPCGGISLLANNSDPLSGSFAFHGTRVRVRRPA